jgi:hypothetical protein
VVSTRAKLFATRATAPPSTPRLLPRLHQCSRTLADTFVQSVASQLLIGQERQLVGEDNAAGPHLLRYEARKRRAVGSNYCKACVLAKRPLSRGNSYRFKPIGRSTIPGSKRAMASAGTVPVPTAASNRQSLRQRSTLHHRDHLNRLRVVTRRQSRRPCRLPNRSHRRRLYLPNRPMAPPRVKRERQSGGEGSVVQFGVSSFVDREFQGITRNPDHRAPRRGLCRSSTARAKATAASNQRQWQLRRIQFASVHSCRRRKRAVRVNDFETAAG